MYFDRGRPRFWIPGFDRIHLVVPALLGLVAVLIATAVPAPPPITSRPEPRTPRPSLAVTILNPTSGIVLTSNLVPAIEGTAPPGVIVHLYWFDRPLGQPTRVGPDGRWSFSSGRFPAGQHLLRAVARWQGGLATSAPVIITVQTPPISAGSPRRKAAR
ncbi:MAG: hypothetical protein RIS76_241 [Verrucomicrobiota bacterium]